MQVERNVAHFVQEQRPAVRQLEAADLLRQGAGEGSSLVAEQFAFQQSGRNGGAVQRDEGEVPARTQPVDGARHQLLAGAGFTEDQHVRVGRRNHFHLPQDPPQGRAVADHLFEVLLAFDVLLFDAFDPVALAGGPEQT